MEPAAEKCVDIDECVSSELTGTEKSLAKATLGLFMCEAILTWWHWQALATAMQNASTVKVLLTACARMDLPATATIAPVRVKS